MRGLYRFVRANRHTTPPAVSLRLSRIRQRAPTGERVPANQDANFTLIPPERLTVWNPGISGGVPARTTPVHDAPFPWVDDKPAFFGDHPWPWVDAAGATKVATLPARARFDAMHP